MLAYKSWRESEARFILSACTLAALCVGFVLFHREGATLADRSRSYVEYIWRIVYKGYLRELFVLLTLLLGVGGLKRERDLGTAGFSLALPVTRTRLVLARVTVGLAEVAALALIPAMTISTLSPLIGQAYPWCQSLQFSFLWAIGGAFLFAIGFLASIIFGGEYTAAVVAVIAMLAYSILADLPLVERYAFDIHDLMSGTGMSYFQSSKYLVIGPLPWLQLLMVTLAVGISVGLGVRVTQNQDF